MKKTKTTKRALLTSALALLLCVSMLVGSTFAWFTDSVTSTGNIIKSGTLDVTMEWKDATANGAQQTYKDASEGAIFKYEKWEPGYVEAKNIKISNAGTLALKYQLNIVATGVVSELTDVIDVYYAEGEIALADRKMEGLKNIGTLTEVLAAISTTASGDLLEGETDTVTLALKMQESAGNKYQGLSIGSEFTVQLMATQLTSESDSFDDQYDKMATIDTEAELLEALAADYDLIQLGANIALSNGVVIPAGKTVAIDLAGYTMSYASTNPGEDMISNKGNLTIEDSVGTGKITYNNTDTTAVNVTASTIDCGPGSVLTINGGTVENKTIQTGSIYSYAIDVVTNGSLGDVTATVNGGKVHSDYMAIRQFNNGEACKNTLNVNGGTITGGKRAIQVHLKNNAAYTNITNGVVKGGDYSLCMLTTSENLSVTGGEFFGDVWYSGTDKFIAGGTFDTDPSAYVADGYVAVKNADDTYSVVKGMRVTNATELAEAVAAGHTELYLADGEYDVYGCAGKTLTINGSRNAVLKVKNEGEDGCDYGFGSGGAGVGNITFNGITIDTTSNSGNYKGYAYMSGTYNDCAFVGGYALHRNSYFYDCEFNFKNNYVWTWGASEVVFDGCTFADENGVAKAILVHCTTPTTVTVKDCVFEGTTTAKTWDSIPVAAVSIDPNGAHNVVVNFEGSNTVSDAYHGMYQCKYANEASLITVKVNGETVEVPVGENDK